MQYFIIKIDKIEMTYVVSSLLMDGNVCEKFCSFANCILKCEEAAGVENAPERRS
jgi:hypothetical protein